MPRAIRLVTAWVNARLEYRPTRILWVKLQSDICAVVKTVRNAHADRSHARCARFRIVALEDNHVTTITIATIKISAGRCSLTGWRYNLKKIRANWQQSIGEPVFPDSRIMMARFKSEYLLQIINWFF